MKQLRACIWIGLSNGENSLTSEELQIVVQDLKMPKADLIFKAEEQGIWAIVSTVSGAIEFGQTVLQTQTGLSILITAGELEQGNEWSGWSMKHHSQLRLQTAPNQIWFTEAVFYLMDWNECSWEEIGMVTTDAGSFRCFRLLLPGQSFVPSALKRAIKEQKVVIDQKGRGVGPIQKGLHVVFVGYTDTDELYSRVARVNTVVPNDKLWLVLPKMDLAPRKEWIDSGRHLIVSTPRTFMQNIQRTDVTLMGKESSATMFLDPVSLSSGEISLFGIALPLVPMAKIINGYTMDLLADGEWGYESDDKVVVRLSVNMQGGFLTALQPGCRLNTREMEIGKTYPLGNGARLTVGRITHRYIANVGKPYLGLFLGEPIRRMAVAVGDRLELGRQPTGGGFALSDRGGSDRIEWVDAPQAHKSKSAKLTLDRAMTGRHHVAISVESVGRFIVSPLHDKLPTYILPSAAPRLQRVMNELVLKEEGLIVVGTNVLRVSKTSTL